MQHRPKRRAAALTGAVALAAGLTAGAPANAQTPEGRAAEGLAALATSGSRLEIDAPAALETTPSIVPEREDFAFLGEPGDLVWLAGTTDGQTFPTLDASDADTDVTLALEKTGGPGEARLYTFEGAGFADPLASTADGGSFTLAAGTTTPVVLAVDEPGQYTLELIARGEGTAERSAPAAVTAAYRLTAEDVTAAEAQAIVVGDGASQDDGATGGAQAAASCEVVGDGHVDIGPRFVDGEWTVQLRDDRAAESVWRDLADTVVHVPDAARFPIPEGDYGFLGEPGREIYMLPQVQASGIVWPGWNTQDPSVIEAVPGSVDWNLTAVDGPGAFTLFLTGTFGGADILFDSADALPQTVAVPRNTHAHGNWTFSEAGIYRLSIEFTATTADGETVTDSAEIQLAVGDATDPSDACTGGGSGSGGDDDEDDEGGFLPTTGTGWLLWGLGAAALAVIVGAVIMAATRKRRTVEGTADSAAGGKAAGGPDAR
ncbi:TIGR03773 family transporter-associated surface protein [Glycomyces sp. TRM65418]|uniref:TIGR03773 family transporter-associated surface protein n=1 Tax=Glycomyces sp. TRM65418 TaxID=2867006 RepID=UPI001CE5B447|nr:TIGR03773 family transporter-associated surface protein [Glycomyces sp. TRM65418]MCC3763116.1 TIGR03773 family transporter-associated surface protein [Glycomyces sp. TRM65418]QZD57124.1 TIGR03773 family transporter-associated surface protein [Glycomyces sp. TRM65418]